MLGLYSTLAVPYSYPSDEDGNAKQKCLMLDLVGFNFFFIPMRSALWGIERRELTEDVVLDIRI